MARVKRGVTARRRHKKVLSKAKGYYGARSRVFRVAKQAVTKAGQYAYRDRRQRKRQFRALWITRINAAARQNATTYSRLIHGLKAADVELDGLARTLSCGDLEVRLTERELAVGEILFAHFNEEIKRDYIYAAVYGHAMKPFSRAADILIARFRKKLREVSEELAILPTRSAGYKLVKQGKA